MRNRWRFPAFRSEVAHHNNAGLKILRAYAKVGWVKCIWPVCVTPVATRSALCTARADPPITLPVEHSRPALLAVVDYSLGPFGYGERARGGNLRLMCSN